VIRCYITDRKSAVSLLDSIARALDDGVTWIQIREKDLEARALIDLVRAAIALPNPHDTKFIVNGRMDVAIAAGAAGLHLPARSVPANRWRAIVPNGFLIGVSCHTVDEVRDVESAGADYALFGPVFAPLSKTSPLAPHGIAGLRDAASAVRIPVLALGGATRENTPLCIDAGAAGVAGISMFQNLFRSPAQNPR
jgi:thiamine-phosphate pyrophosphorylase